MARVLEATPREDGFYMPAEHEPQDRVWMAWPERPDSFRWGAKPAQKAYAAVAEAIAEETPVTVVTSRRQYGNARLVLPDHIRVIEMAQDDAWMRDTGPSFLVDGKGGLRAVDWEFNAWGGLVDGLFFPWDRDDAIAGKICEIEEVDRYRAPFILEGGSIHVDGDGTAFTTEECLLDPSRNPDMTKEEIEAELKAYLNVQKVIWFPRGLYDDIDTNGHIDNLLHVVKEGEVVLTYTDDTRDPQYEISQEALSILENSRDAKGRKFVVHKLPMPGPLFITEDESEGFDEAEGLVQDAGARLAASYANFLITNNRIVFPLLDPAKDAIAAAKLREIFPDHKVVGVPAREILLGGGNIHCITQQQPARQG